MSQTVTDDELEVGRWVRYHVVAFFAVIGVAIGLAIVDAKIAAIIGNESIVGFRAILLLSVLLAGVGARALLAWRSATVDRQGRIFLTGIGLALLTGAAFGLSYCVQEIQDGFSKPQQSEPSSQRSMGSAGITRGEPAREAANGNRFQTERRRFRFDSQRHVAFEVDHDGRGWI